MFSVLKLISFHIKSNYSHRQYASKFENSYIFITMFPGGVLVLDQFQPAALFRTAPQVHADRPRELDTTGRNTGQTKSPVGKCGAK